MYIMALGIPPVTVTLMIKFVTIAPLKICKPKWNVHLHKEHVISSSNKGNKNVCDGVA